MARPGIRHAAALAAAAVAFSGGVGVLATKGAAPASAAPGSIRVITHNLEKEGTALTAVFTKAGVTSGPEVLLLQEVCGNMVSRLQEKGPTTFHLRRNVTTDQCASGTIGEAVVWTGSGWHGDLTVELVRPEDNGAYGDHRFGMACLNIVYEARNIRACSTHLIAGGEEVAGLRHELTRRIKDTVSPWIAEGRTVLVGGDFNTTPTTATMNAMYGVGSASAGQFRELHQMASGTTQRAGLHTIGRSTGSQKFDYIFGSMPSTRSSGGTQNTCWNGLDNTADCGTTSNHRMLWGAVPLS